MDNQMILRKNHQCVTSTFDKRNIKAKANENVQQVVKEGGTDRGRRNLYESMKKPSSFMTKRDNNGYEPFSPKYKDEINQYLQPKTLVIEPQPISMDSK